MQEVKPLTPGYYYHVYPDGAWEIVEVARDCFDQGWVYFSVGDERETPTGDADLRGPIGMP